jgi:signal transduction histidine kinase
MSAMHGDAAPRPDHPRRGASQEQRFQALFQQAPVSIQILAPDGRTLGVNKAWETLFQLHAGHPVREQFLNGQLNVLTDPQLVASGVAAFLRRAIAGESVEIPPIRFDVALLDGPAHARWIKARAHPVKDEQGAVVEVMLMHEDITERVEADAALRASLEHEKRNAALLAKVARASRTLHTALSSTEIAEALVEEVRTILEVHHASVSLSGREHVRQAIKAVSRAADATEPAPMRARLAVPLVDRKGRNIGLIEAWDKHRGEFTEEDEAILVQLASIAANGFENAGLYGSLQEQDRRKDAFLAMLAQELRHPLAPLSGAMDALAPALAGASDPRVREAGGVIGRQVRSLGALADDLLDVSRVARGQIQLERARVDVGAVLKAAVEQVRPLIEARGHVLVVEDASGGAAVIGDARRLVQVFVNLLDNAARYTPPGGRIVVSVTRQAPALRIAVRDDGIGIEAGLLPHVFELFTRTEGTTDRIQGGLGIGLALVRNIVDLHGGTVAAYSQGPGQGSVFTLSLATVPD